jgi:hypothetical protein
MIGQTNKLCSYFTMIYKKIATRVQSIINRINQRFLGQDIESKE